MKPVLISIFSVLLSLVDSNQLQGRRSDLEKGQGAWQVRTDIIEIHLLSRPYPAFIYADSSHRDSILSTRYFRDLGGYKLCMTPAKYWFFKAILLESIRRTKAGAQDRGHANTAIVRLRAEDQKEVDFMLTDQEADTVFQEVLKRASDKTVLLTRHKTEPVQELFYMIGYYIPDPRRDKK